MIIYSSTPLRARAAHDHYPTPLALAQAVLRLPTIPWVADDTLPIHVFDPGAGSGVWGTAVRERWPSALIGGCDIRDIPAPDAYNIWYPSTDFETVRMKAGGTDLIVGNPPYRFAEQFVRHGYDLLQPHGAMIYLLRLAFLEGQKRGQALWQTHRPRAVYVCSARPSFITEGDKAGKTDATAYAIFVWWKGYRGDCQLDWMDWKREE